MKAAQSARTFIPYGQHFLDAEDIRQVADTLRQGPITQGPRIKAFEEALATYVGAKYAVAVANGTAALHIACLAAGIGREDRVVTSPNTFIASANATLYVGATPIFSDIHPDTLNMDLTALAATCHSLKNIKAIIPVHFAGLPCDMAAIRTLGKKNKALIIEDAAHALGAKYADGVKVGSCRYSDMTTFSFHPVKIIASGEGGAVTTNDEELYHKLLQLRNHGITKDSKQFRDKAAAFTDGEVNPWYYEMQDLGFNYRITDFQAALGTSQLRKIEAFLKRRKEIAARYDEAFASETTLTVTQKSGRKFSANHLYVVRIPFATAKMNRARLMTELKKRSIGTQVHYLPVYRHPYYQEHDYSHASCLKAEAYYKEALSLPIYYGLTDEEQKYVIASLKELLS
jgi:UDP-4-amino-4,6-dideoxy-N-acetyl-beta-L-altrosamine transaminase